MGAGFLHCQPERMKRHGGRILNLKYSPMLQIQRVEFDIKACISINCVMIEWALGPDRDN
jgi:hypothetical protein